MALKLTKTQDDIKNSLDALIRILDLHGVEMEEAGREYLGLCPFHDERTPSFRAYQKDDEPALYKCFGCQESGNIFQFVMQKDGLSFTDAAKKVESQLEWEADKKEVERTFHEENKRKKDFVTFPLSKMDGATRALDNSREAQEWLTGRGITLESARRFHLGYVQSVAGIDSKHPWGDKGWVIFPVIDGDRIVSLKYRSIFRKKSEDGKISGFLRAPNMETRLFGLSAINPGEDVFLVEGEMDAVAMGQAGYIAVSLPSAGFNITPAQRATLLRANRVFLAGDNDPAGQATMKKLWVELRDRTFNIEWPTRIEGSNEKIKDANDILKAVKDTAKFKHIVEMAKRKAIEQPIPYVYDIRSTLRQGVDVKAVNDPRRLRWPWSSFDKAVLIRPTNLVTVFARESKVGKTTWLQNILLYNAMFHDKVILNYGVELSPGEYGDRVACQLTKTPREQIGNKERTEAADLLDNCRFYNGWKPGARYKEVMELLIAAKKNLGADIIVIDTLHFITSAEGEHETAAQNDMMRSLKELAAEYDCIVIVVGQPNKMKGDSVREATARDAKGSEALGSTANYVFILDRKRVKGSERTEGEDETVFEPMTSVKLDYARDSKTWIKKLFFDEVFCTFAELPPAVAQPVPVVQGEIVEVSSGEETSF